MSRTNIPAMGKTWQAGKRRSLTLGVNFLIVRAIFKFFLIAFLPIICLGSCEIDVSGANRADVSQSAKSQAAQGDYYLEKFLMEGAKRDIRFDTASAPLKGLIVESVPLPDTVGGQCLINPLKPHRVEVNSFLLGSLSALQKELLYFHEFGHCLLHRPHRNDTLPNGEWASLMADGKMKNAKRKEIDYTGQKRHYYLNELFNEDAAIPDWARVKIQN